MTDESDCGVYRFTFYCDICDSPWKSDPYRSMSEEPDDAIKRDSEHNAAYERANRVAMSFFNRCPKCRMYVCDKCFNILEEMDLCDKCANSRTKP